MANYQSPTWVNNQAPKLNAANLQLLTDTVEASQVLSGNGAPGSSVAAVVGQRYVDESTTPGTIYKCTSVENGDSIWEKEVTRTEFAALEAETQTAYESFATDTTSGAIASFPDGADEVPVKSMVVNIAPVQAGSGDPSPDNLRAISGRTGLTLYHSGADTTDYESVAVSWGNEAGAIYGGTLDLQTGILTVTKKLVTVGAGYSKSNITSVTQYGTDTGFWLALGTDTDTVSDKMQNRCNQASPSASISVAGGTTNQFGASTTYPNSVWVRLPTETVGSTVDSVYAYITAHPLEFAVGMASPVSFQLAPHPIRTLYGENNFWSDAGEVEVEYRANTNLYIEKTAYESFATDTASGAIASFADGADGVPVKSMVVNIAPAQAGSGVPSPNNLRAISGRTGLTLYHSGADTTDYESVDVSWESEAGGIYGGTLDLQTGILTATKKLVTVDESISVSRISSVTQYGTDTGFWLALGTDTDTSADKMQNRCNQASPSASISVAGGTTNQFGASTTYPNSVWVRLPTETVGSTVDSVYAYITAHPMEFAVGLATPVTFYLAPHPIRTLYGENNLWSNAGEVEVEYRANTNLYIDKRLETLAANFAAVENGDFASRNYTVGEFLVYGGSLYKVSAAIASGETLTPGTNITPATVGAELTELEA